MMFRDATNGARVNAQNIEDALVDHLEYLDRTAAMWYDQTAASVTIRQAELLKGVGLCRRAAAVVDDEADASDITDVGDQLQAQASQLESFAHELRTDEYENRVGSTLAPQFSSLGNFEDPRVSNTDWDLFLDTEPRFFVAENRSTVHDANEMRTRAYNFMVDTVTGNGMSRQAKIDVTTAFLARVESERRLLSNKVGRKSKTAKVAVDLPDSALF